MALPSQEDLIMQQFASAKKGLNQTMQSGEQGLQDQQNRQGAITGLQGGSIGQANEKARADYERGFGQDQANLDAQQAQALQGVAAQREGQQFQTSERLGSQDFSNQQLSQQEQYGTQERLGSQGYQTGERLGSQDFAAQQAQQERGFQGQQSALDRGQQSQQFSQQMGFQDKQFETQKAQFQDQMNYQWQEFNENTRTNLINATVAIQKAGLSDQGYFQASSNNAWNLRNEATDYSGALQGSAPTIANPTQSFPTFDPNSVATANPNNGSFGGGTANPNNGSFGGGQKVLFDGSQGTSGLPTTGTQNPMLRFMTANPNYFQGNF